jgi:hypothetical protein
MMAMALKDFLQRVFAGSCHGFLVACLGQLERHCRISPVIAV